jgi:membrane fusion protein, multidrug efflux system
VSIFKQLVLVVVIGGIAYGGYRVYQQYALAHTAEGPAETAQTSAPATPVDLVRAGFARTDTRVDAVGTTFSRRSVQIVPLASGRVQELHFEPGAIVAQGDPLASLDDDIERANLTEAEATLREAQLALDRARTLRQSSTISQASVETLISQQAIARAALDRARRRLDDRVVRAPFDGITGLARVDPGAIVDDDSVITTLDDRREVDIEFSLPETLYGRIVTGLPITATAAAFPGRRFDGEIVSIDTRVDPAGRSFKVRARVPNRDMILPAGMFIHLTVVLESRQALVVPEGAIVAEGDSTYVWVAGIDDTATRRTVSLGQREMGSVEITDGLSEGERVVVRGVQRLRDGTPLRVLSEREMADNGSGPA